MRKDNAAYSVGGGGGRGNHVLGGSTVYTASIKSARSRRMHILALSSATKNLSRGVSRIQGRGVSTIAVTGRMRCLCNVIACVSGLLQYHFPLIPSVADAEIQKEGFRLIPDCKPRKRSLLGGFGGILPQKIFEK